MLSGHCVARLKKGQKLGQKQRRQEAPQPGGGWVLPLHCLEELVAGWCGAGGGRVGGAQLGHQEEGGAFAYNQSEGQKTADQEDADKLEDPVGHEAGAGLMEGRRAGIRGV